MVCQACLLLVKYFQTGTFRWGGAFLDYGYDRRALLPLSVSLFLLFRSLRPGRVISALGSYVGTKTQAVFFLHMPLLNLLLWVAPSLMTVRCSCLMNLLKTCLVIAICLAAQEILIRIPILKKLV